METIKAPDIYVMSPEEEAILELDALLGAAQDAQMNDRFTQAEKQQRDQLIFGNIKNMLQTAEGLQNVYLTQTINERLSAIACNDNHFAQQLEKFDVYGRSTAEPGELNHTHASDENEDEKDKKSKKKDKKKYTGLLSWFSKV